ncbi:MAG: hypothetical protein R2860_11690 [Desulfobacterales bacterium]
MRIRWELNPHPAGQEHNIPVHNGRKLPGAASISTGNHLVFSQARPAMLTAHSASVAQFVGMNDIKFAMRETSLQG